MFIDVLCVHYMAYILNESQFSSFILKILMKNVLNALMMEIMFFLEAFIF